jgi:AcrR family transcriptional regulator
MAASQTDTGLADTRERILATTWALMEKSGDLQVRIADIAAGAGVSRQAVYLHFGNRANLLLAAVQYRDRESPTADIKRAAEDDPIPQALTNFVHAWFAHIPRIQPVAHLLSAASQTDPDARLAFADRMNLLRTLIGSLVARLAAGDMLRADWTPTQAVDWIWHNTHLDGWWHLVGQRNWDPAEFARRVSASLARDLIKPEKIEP